MHSSITTALERVEVPPRGIGFACHHGTHGQEIKATTMQKTLVTIAVAASLGLGATASAQAGILEDVVAKGYIQCGVTGGVAGFSAPDSNNVWTGLEVDYCRALAAAIFNDADAVRFTSLTSQERFTALSAGEVDVLSRTTRSEEHTSELQSRENL